MMSLQNIKKNPTSNIRASAEGEHKLGNLINIILKLQSRNLMVVLVVVLVTLVFTAPTVKKMSDVVQ